MAGEKYDYNALLDKYSDLKTWYDNLFNSSPSLVEDRLRRIGYVCRIYKTNPDKLAKLSAKEGQRLIVSIIIGMHKAGKSVEYQKPYVKALKSWFLQTLELLPWQLAPDGTISNIGQHAQDLKSHTWLSKIR
ncbi:MAG: hypothetical protein ABI361_11550 [Nitrososphaera sp.]